MSARKIFIVLVTFERGEGHSLILPEDTQGACGYMAVAADCQEAVIDALLSDLREIKLNLVEVEEMQEVDINKLPPNLDEHLVSNIQEWESGKRTVWGTLHTYLGDGEA